MILSTTRLAVLACSLLGLTVSLSPGQALNPQTGRIQLAQKAFPQLVQEGYVKGIRELHVIRPDLVMLRLDWGAVGGWETDDTKLPQGPYTVADVPSFYAVQSETDSNYQSPVEPVAIGRASQAGYNAKNKDWSLVVNEQMIHDVHLQIPHPLKSGNTYTISVKPVRPVAGLRYEMKVVYDDVRTLTPAIKVNQVGYSSLARQRYAYLGWWQGMSKGAVSYDDFAGKPFHVLPAKGGAAAMSGTINLRRKADTLSGEDIYELDLSPLRVGAYYIHVPGLGRSYDFHVGGQPVVELYYHTMRAFYHQRCGIELGAPHTWVRRPACHVSVAQNGWIAEGNIAMGGELIKDAKPVPADMQTRSFKGGYHDAADFDAFTYHLPGTRRILEIYEMMPEVFRDGDLDLPESGNGIPDLLDEAEWGIMGHLLNQQEDGGVPLGRINECDSLRQNFETENGDAREKGYAFPPFGIIPPTQSSSSMFAAAAAEFAIAIRPFDEVKSQKYLDAAIRGFEFDVKHKPSEVAATWNRDPNLPKLRVTRVENWDKKHPQHLAIAAGVLLRATGDRKYEPYLRADPQFSKVAYEMDLRVPAVLVGQSPALSDDLRAHLKTDLLAVADKLVERTQKGGYRMNNGEGTMVGWGAAQGIDQNGVLICAYQLTGEQKYLDTISLNADFHLGCNPLGKVFLTGMGRTPPRRPEISGYLYQTRDPDFRGGQIKGIGIYGFGPPLKDPEDPERRWPLWRSWGDIWGNFREIYSEFTLHQTVAPAAQTYGFLYGLEKKQGTLGPDIQRPDPTLIGTESWAPQPAP